MNLPSPPSPEPWLRGPLAGVDARLAPTLRSFEQASEDLAHWTHGLSADAIWDRPRGVASLGFHLRHIAGSVDRLATYLAGRQLDAAQLAELEGETGPPRADCDGRGDREDREALLAAVERSLSRAAAVVSTIDVRRLDEPREVGRGRLPTTVLGLLVHLAEHTQRHVGQAIVLAQLANRRERRDRREETR